MTCLTEIGKQTIRAQFRHYRNQIAELEEALANQRFYADEALGRAEANARKAERDAEYERAEAWSARFWHEDDVRRAREGLGKATDGGT